MPKNPRFSKWERDFLFSWILNYKPLATSFLIYGYIAVMEYQYFKSWSSSLCWKIRETAEIDWLLENENNKKKR